MRRTIAALLVLVATVALLSACGEEGATGDLGRLDHLAETCAGADLATYVAVDFSDTARSESLGDRRRGAVHAEAERVAVCGGTLKVVAFSSSTAATMSLFDGRLEAEGATLNARLRRVDRTVDPALGEVLNRWAEAEAALPGDGSDVLGQLTLASEYFRQRPDAAHRAVILTDGVQTTGAVVVNSPDFTSAAAADLAARVTVPDLSGVDLTVAGLGQVAGAPPPTEFVDALNRFFTDTCTRTHATCQIVTDLASN